VAGAQSRIKILRIRERVLTARGLCTTAHKPRAPFRALPPCLCGCLIMLAAGKRRAINLRDLGTLLMSLIALVIDH
jgi:hypothetical protein